MDKQDQILDSLTRLHERLDRFEAPAKPGMKVVDACKAMGISLTTFYRQGLHHKKRKGRVPHELIASHQS